MALGFPGEKQNMLTLIEPVGKYNRKTVWRALCDCGKETKVTTSDFHSNNTKSCGCQKGAGGKRSLTTHGFSSHPDYELWRQMHRRCKDANWERYKDYGGRGIQVCERWNDFKTFCEDMGPRPTPEHSIERKNNDGNYEPSNCKWATRKEQYRNKRDNVWVVVKGNRMIVKDAYELLGFQTGEFYKLLRVFNGNHQKLFDFFERP